MQQPNITETTRQPSTPQTNLDEPPEKKPTPPKQNETYNYQEPNDAGGKKKTQERGGDLDVGAEQGVRIEAGERGHEEATLGEPQTPQGVWASPAPERERKKERKNVVGGQTKTAKKNRGDTNINANMGLVLKGTKPNNMSTPETKNVIQKTKQISQKPRTKMPLTYQTKSRRSYHRRVAGPMGRPALLGSRPGGPWYRRVRKPPHHGNRPR